MFSKFITVLSVAALAISGVVASPITYKKGMVKRGSGTYSMENWGGHQSLHGFDNFYGSNNWDGSRNSQTVVVHENEVVCHSQQVEIIQQRLVILQEMAKRIVTEQICEVETQTIVFKQHHDSMANFYHDLSRGSGHSVGYDRSITGHYGNMFNGDGSLSNNDLGFSGQSVGSNYVAVGGSNWDNNSSPQNVQNAYNAAQSASQSTSRFF